MNIFSSTAVMSFVLSLAGKFLADEFLTARIPVIDSFVGLQYATNSGVAFSITFPGPLQKILIGVALLGVLWAAVKAKTKISRISFGMIIGGALGNVMDRVMDGVVTDFFQVGTFPIFNVADSCITIGVAILLLEAIVQWSHK